MASALGEEQPSREALRIQRFEAYESVETLSRFCLPLKLGDIFEKRTNGRRYILLAQPCDLMVRKDGKRSYDDKNGRTGALVELVVGCTKEQAKDGWEAVPFYNEDTGAPAFVDFAKVHQVRLAVLDLCSLREDGVAEIDLDAACPDVVVEPWKERYGRLQKLFAAALAHYEELGGKQVRTELKSLALPAASATVRFNATVNGKAVQYDLKRVMRLRQPRSGALLTAFAQYQSRAAFEHPFDHRVPTAIVPDDSPEADEDGDSGSPG